MTRRINKNISSRLPRDILNIVREYCGVDYIEIANSLRNESKSINVRFFNSEHLDELSYCLFESANNILNNSPSILKIVKNTEKIVEDTDEYDKIFEKSDTLHIKYRIFRLLFGIHESRDSEMSRDDSYYFLEYHIINAIFECMKIIYLKNLV
jgi:hypothetical protein